MNIIKSLYQSFKKAFIDNENVQGLKKKYPYSFNFIKLRLDRTKFSGLPLTILSAIFLYALLLFFGSIGDYMFSDIITEADVRVNTLLYAFRNAGAIKTFLWITLLGESPTIIVFALVTSALLYLTHKKWQVVTLWLTIIGSEGFTFMAKLIFQRPRPLNAVFLEDSNSFPSGHSTIAVAFYGFLAYLVFKKLKNKILRVLTVLITILIILSIGFSRLYLGVHYVSDVWTGYLVGFLWLIIGIGLTELKSSEQQNNSFVQNIATKHPKIIIGGLVSLAIIFYISYGFTYHPKLILKSSATIEMTVEATNIFRDFNLPRYTETLVGGKQEPISLIITANDDTTVINNFKKAGWTLADKVNLNSILETIKYSIYNHQYDTAPMTPSFWNKQIHDLGFEKSTETKSVRQRHHARFWKTNFKTVGGDNIYVGTASLDVGIKWFITHRINPDIDTERDLLFNDLQKTGSVANFEKLKLVSPILGQNFIGDPFFTDGVAYFLNFSR